MKTQIHIKLILVMSLASAVFGQALAETTENTVKLTRVDGNVMVNQGTNYTRAISGTVLKTGAKIITARGASVALLYKDGCIKQVKENSILTLISASECTAMKTNERVYLAEALGETLTDAPPAGAGSFGGGESFLGGGGISPGMVLGALAIGGAAIAVSGHNDHNASPQ